jgi:hypothetical protein
MCLDAHKCLEGSNSSRLHPSGRHCCYFVIGLILIGQNQLYVKMLFNKDSAIQKCSRDSTLFASQEKSVPCQPSGWRLIPSGRSSVHSSSSLDDVPYRPDARQTKVSSVRTTWISFQTLLWIEKLLIQLASVQTIQQPVPTTLSDQSSFRFSFQNQIWEDCCNRPDDGIPVRKRYSLRQVRNSNSTVQTSVCHGPDPHSTDMEIVCRRSTVRTTIPHGLDAQSLVKEITCSGHATVRTTVPHRPDAALKQERFLVKISEFRSHSCPFERPMSTVPKAPVFIKAVTHLNPQPINRGPWAMRTARIRYWIPLELRELFVRLLSWFVLFRAIIVCVVAALKLKSILGVGPKVKDSIEDPFW